MTERLLFVDLENVQTLDLSEVPPDVRVRIFRVAAQKKLPQPLGSRLEWIKIEGHGSNALDFHIAFYLGQPFAKAPQSECVIVSKDTGFDPLLNHLKKLGHACRRVSTLQDAFASRKAHAVDDFARLVKLLSENQARPVKRTGPAGRVKSWFPRLSEGQRQRLLQRLFDEGHVQAAQTRLTYRG